MCLDGETLYVADTENHAIRAIDLKSKTGDARSPGPAPRRPAARWTGTSGAARTSALSSPWDIIQVPGSPAFYIAMAGPHQIWKLNRKTGKIGVWAGSGYREHRGRRSRHRQVRPAQRPGNGRQEPLCRRLRSLGGPRDLRDQYRSSGGRQDRRSKASSSSATSTAPARTSASSTASAWPTATASSSSPIPTTTRSRSATPIPSQSRRSPATASPAATDESAPLLSTRRSERGWRQPVRGRHEQSQDSRDRYQVGQRSGHSRLLASMLLVRRRFPRSRPTDHLPATWIRPLLDSCSTFHSSSRVSRISGTARFTFPTRARISSRILSMRVIRCLSEIRCRSILSDERTQIVR